MFVNVRRVVNENENGAIYTHAEHSFQYLRRFSYMLMKTCFSVFGLNVYIANIAKKLINKRTICVS